MKAIVLEGFGGPDMLQMRERPTPGPGVGEVLVRVLAAGICHHDVMHRAGKLPGAKTGVILGHEIAGEIVAVGADVAAARVGEMVVVYQRRFCGRCRDCLRGRQDLCRAKSLPSVDAEGGSAEFVCVPESSVVAVPAGVSAIDAALASCPIATSLRALTSVARLQPGDVVLVNGASGGLGAHQLQLVRAFGGRAIAVTTSRHKEDFLRRVGAHDVVVADDGAFGAQVWALTKKRGVDIALDNVGNRLDETLRCMALGGTCVVLGNIETKPAPVAPGLLIGRRITLAGSGMATPDEVRHALALIAAGCVKPVVSAVMPFDRIGEAHRLLDARAVEGRIVMQGW